jgi:hypothetical protein
MGEFSVECRMEERILLTEKHQFAYLPETRSASDHADESTAKCDSARKKTIKNRGDDTILQCDLVPKNDFVAEVTVG